MKSGRDVEREILLHRYIRALDDGDAAGIAAVLEAAGDDVELDQVIDGVNRAIHIEESLSAEPTAAARVRALLREHLPSAFSVQASDSLTVGEVAARLQADKRVPASDQQANRQLLHSSSPLPQMLDMRAIRQMANELSVAASEGFWRAFRDVAIAMGMGRTHGNARWAAAREERARYTIQNQTAPASAEQEKPDESSTDQHEK